MQELAIVQVSDPPWQFAPVALAATRRQRLAGLRPASSGRGLLVRGSSVHGFGMQEPLVAVFLDDAGTVLAIEILAPQTVVWNRGAAWVLELPPGTCPPEPGSKLSVARHTT